MIKKTILSLLIFLYTGIVCAKEKTVFNQDFGFENFINYIVQYEETNNLKNNSNFEPTYLSQFISKVLYNHFDYISKIMSKKNNYSKNILVSIDVAIENSEIAKDKEYLRRFIDTSNSSSYIFWQLAKSKEMLSTYIFIAVYLKLAFYAMDDNQYLKYLLTYLSDQSIMVRTIAFKMINRDQILTLVNNMGVDRRQVESGDKEIYAKLGDKGIFKQIN